MPKLDFPIGFGRKLRIEFATASAKAASEKISDIVIPALKDTPIELSSGEISIHEFLVNEGQPGLYELKNEMRNLPRTNAFIRKLLNEGPHDKQNRSFNLSLSFV